MLPPEVTPFIWQLLSYCHQQAGRRPEAFGLGSSRLLRLKMNFKACYCVRHNSEVIEQFIAFKGIFQEKESFIIVFIFLPCKYMSQ